MAVAIVAFGLAQARLCLALGTTSSVFALGSHLFQLVGVAVAFAVVANEFSRRLESQQRQLRDSLLLARTNDVRRDGQRAIGAARQHEVRNALFAVRGAATTLAERYERLADEDRQTLGRIVGTGIERIAALVQVQVDEIEEFDVAAMVHSVVKAEEHAGADVQSSLSTGLRGMGRAGDVAAVLRLLVRAARVGSRGPVAIRGRSEGGTVRLVVEATGSAVSPIVTSAQDANGELDLHIAARLMSEQGGAVWTSGRQNGHISFGVRLPAPGIR
jgi:nitrogen-specific signal transduction histidine kinase